MSDYLTLLTARILPQADVIQPRLASLFEPPGAAGSAQQLTAEEPSAGPPASGPGLREESPAPSRAVFAGPQPAPAQREMPADAPAGSPREITTRPGRRSGQSPIQPATPGTVAPVPIGPETPDNLAARGSGKPAGVDPVAWTAPAAAAHRTTLQMPQPAPPNTSALTRAGPHTGTGDPTAPEAAQPAARWPTGSAPSTLLTPHLVKPAVRIPDAVAERPRKIVASQPAAAPALRSVPPALTVVRPQVTAHDARSGMPVSSKVRRATPDTTIHVTIGRIEVRATSSTGSPPQRQRSSPPVMSLEEYLRRRASGGGG